MAESSIQTEIDAAFLYGRLADHEKDPVISRIFRQMSEIEQGHAAAFAQKAGIPSDRTAPPFVASESTGPHRSDLRLRHGTGRLDGHGKSISNAIVRTKQQLNEPVTGNEANHVRILRPS